MRIVLGLGNPGPDYVNTRHNAGVMLVDNIANRLLQMVNSSYGWRKHFGAMVFKTDNLWLVKTKEVFMNESGRLLQGLPEGELWVAHDDLDIRLGEYKIQKAKGPREHGGINSIEFKTGKDFWRIRMGIDNRPAGILLSGEDYVLGKIDRDEREKLDGVIEQIANDLKL